MRHGFFITCLAANQARPIIGAALMADICARSLLLDTVCNEDKSDYSKCVGCQASREGAARFERCRVSTGSGPKYGKEL